MEAGSVALRRPHSGRHRSRTPEQSRMDSALVRAKREGRKVRLSLAMDTDYTQGEECSCEAMVEWVDSMSILFRIEGRSIWVMKAFLVSVELLDA